MAAAAAGDGEDTRDVVAFDVGVKNLAFARVRWSPGDPVGTWRVVAWRKVDIKSSTQSAMLRSLHYVVRAVAAIRETDTVVIERQMMSPVMVGISFAIFAQCMELTSERGRSDAAVRFAGAGDKLGHDLLLTVCPGSARVAGGAGERRAAGVGEKRPRAAGYGANKEEAVAAASALLAENGARFTEEAARTFRDAVKRDDLADALLHALAYALGGAARGRAVEVAAARRRAAGSAVVTLGDL